jgi:hypothetical protein
MHLPAALAERVAAGEVGEVGGRQADGAHVAKRRLRRRRRRRRRSGRAGLGSPFLDGLFDGPVGQLEENLRFRRRYLKREKWGNASTVNNSGSML